MSRLARPHCYCRSRSASNPLSPSVILLSVYAEPLVGAGQAVRTLTLALNIKVGVVELRQLLPGVRLGGIFQVVLRDDMLALVVQATI